MKGNNRPTNSSALFKIDRDGYFVLKEAASFDILSYMDSISVSCFFSSLYLNFTSLSAITSLTGQYRYISAFVISIYDDMVFGNYHF